MVTFLFCAKRYTLILECSDPDCQLQLHKTEAGLNSGRNRLKINCIGLMTSENNTSYPHKINDFGWLVLIRC